MKPKLSDVARYAGVSLATADRVINNRPGVRQATREKVMKAVEELGYKPDPIAARLAKTKRLVIALLIPKDAHGIYQSIERNWQDIRKSTELSRATLILQPYSAWDEEDMLSSLDKVSRDADGVLICATDMPAVRSKVLELRGQGKLVYSLLTDLGDAVTNCYVGYDQYSLGRTVGYFLRMLTAGEQGILLSHTYFPETQAYHQRMQGKQDFLDGCDWDVNLVSVLGRDEHNRCGNAVRNWEDKGETVTGLTCWGDDCLHAKSSSLFDPESGKRPKIILMVLNMTPVIVKALLDEKVDAVFLLEASNAVKRAVTILHEELERQADATQDDRKLDEFVEFNVYVKENLPQWFRDLAQAA